MHSLLKGTPKRPYPLEDVAHEECKLAFGGCMPAGGCELRMGYCEPKVGHYWPIGDAPTLPYGLGAVLPKIAPPYRMMTKRGLMEGRPTFWWTTYKLLVRIYRRL